MAPRERIVSIVLAAGAAARFGGRKQLAPLRGKPLLEYALAAATATSTSSTLVVLGADAGAVAAGIDLGTAEIVECHDWQRGPGASLRAGLLAAGADCAAAVVTLGDEPFLSPAATDRLIAARSPGLAALRATYNGRPGHPVLIERSLFPVLTDSETTARPRDVLRAAGIRDLECGDLGDPGDVDTVEQLLRLQDEPLDSGSASGPRS
jgi:molybdenum cofactor cytidylyltransferase